MSETRSQSNASSPAPHPGVLCDNPKCPECTCPPCPTCGGKGLLAIINPRGYAIATCYACGGCGAQL